MMNQFAGNGLTLEELEQIEEAAHRRQTPEAEIVLRLAAALREALQMKVNACPFCLQFNADRKTSSNRHFKH